MPDIARRARVSVESVRTARSATPLEEGVSGHVTMLQHRPRSSRHWSNELEFPPPIRVDPASSEAGVGQQVRCVQRVRPHLYEVEPQEFGHFVLVFAELYPGVSGVVIHEHDCVLRGTARGKGWRFMAAAPSVDRSAVRGLSVDMLSVFLSVLRRNLLSFVPSLTAHKCNQRSREAAERLSTAVATRSVPGAAIAGVVV